MRGGNLSNETPKRILVNLDVITDTKVVMEKVLHLQLPKLSYEYDIRTLSALWHMRGKLEVSMELFATSQEQGVDGYRMDQIEEELAEKGTHPFSWFTAYESIEDVVRLLPYRREVTGVYDPARALRYGSYHTDLFRGI